MKTKNKFSREGEMNPVFLPGIAYDVSRFRLVLGIEAFQPSDLMVLDFTLAKHSASFVEDINVVQMFGVFRSEFLR